MGKIIPNISTAGLLFRLVDAKGQIVGRLASQVATILQGKDKPLYAPHKNEGDVVVVINADKMAFTRKKFDEKVYRWHTGFPGGLKQRTVREQQDKDPTVILKRAVMGMLPKNTLRYQRAKKLRIFCGEEHPFGDNQRLVNFSPPPRKLRLKGPMFEIPEGWSAMNPLAYLKRFGHRLPQPVAPSEAVE